VTLQALVMRIPGRHLLAAVLLVVLVYYFLCGISTHRLPGWWFVLGIIAGLVLCALTVLRVAGRAVTLKLPASLRPVALHADRFVLLLVVNLIMVSVLSPVLRIFAAVPGFNPVSHGVLVAASALTGRVLLFIFVFGVSILGWILLLHVFGGAIGRWRLVRATGRALDRLAVGLAVGVCATGLALIANGALDTSPPVSVRAEVADVTGVELPLGLFHLAWVELRDYPARGLKERILLIPQRDAIWPQRSVPGLPVTIETGGGFLGLRWVRAIRIDDDLVRLRILDAVPTATTFRKWHIQNLWRERNWTVMMEHARAHARAYPDDREYMLTLVQALEAAGQTAHAAALGKAVQP
jgi:hypothetical protein